MCRADYFNNILNELNKPITNMKKESGISVTIDECNPDEATINGRVFKAVKPAKNDGISKEDWDWVPEYNEQFNVVAEMGQIISIPCDENGKKQNSISRTAYLHGTGNIHKTKEEALEYRSHLKWAGLLWKANKLIKLLNDGWEPDWSNSDESKYYPCFDCIDKVLYVQSAHYTKSRSLGYLKSRDAVEKFIKIFGEENCKELLKVTEI